MAKNKKGQSGHKFTTSGVIPNEKEVARAKRNQHRKESQKAFGKTLVNGVKQNVQNLADVAAQAGDLNVAGVLKGIWKGGKDMHSQNVSALKSLIGWITGKNHKEWYTKYGNAITNLGFNAPKGSKTNAWKTEAYGVSIPYVDTLPGDFDSATECNIQVIKTAVDMLYMKLGGSNASTFPFTRDQLFNYIQLTITIRERMEYMASYIRAMNTFNSYDTDSPKPLLAIFGTPISATNSVMTSRAAAIDAYNLLAKRVSAILPIFPDLAILDRKLWLASTLFRDDSDEYKAGLIKFIPCTKVDVDEDSILTYTMQPPIGSKNPNNLFQAITLDEELEMINSMINQVFEHCQGAQIASYLLKAYGDRAYMTIPMVDAQQSINSVYDEQILCQFKNAYYSEFASEANGAVAVYLTKQGSTANYETNYVSTTVKASSDLVSDTNSRELLTQISNEDDKVDAGTTMSLTRLATPLIARPKSTKEVIVTPSVIGTELLLLPYIVDARYSSRAKFEKKIVVNGNNATGESLPNLEYIALRTQTAGVPDLLVIDALNGKPFDSAPYKWYTALGDFEITANYSKEQAVTINHYVTMSLYKTIDVEDQDNWKATTL